MLCISCLAMTLPLVMPPAVAAVNRKASHLVGRTGAATSSAFATTAIFVACPGHLSPWKPAHALLCGSFQPVVHDFGRDGVAERNRRGFLLHAEFGDNLDICKAFSVLYRKHYIYVASAKAVGDMAHFVTLREASDVLSTFTLQNEDDGVDKWEVRARIKRWTLGVGYNKVALDTLETGMGG